jgi:hypothetical protein
MAAFTFHPDMFPLDRKQNCIVIEGKRGPIRGGVTIATLRAKIAFVFVTVRMAGIASGGGTFVGGVLVASVARYRGMASGQFIGR